jgi:hypothetical protein
VFEKVDKTRENVSRMLTETFPVRINPLTRAVGDDVAFIHTCRLMQAARSPGRPRSAGRPRGRQIHDRAGFSAPRERARARIDEGIQPGPRLPQVVQLAAEIGQCLGIARFRPEGACDPLTWDRSAAGMENQEGDELLLSRAWWTGGDSPGGENTEPSEQLDAQGGWNSHRSRLHAIAKEQRSTRGPWQFHHPQRLCRCAEANQALEKRAR